MIELIKGLDDEVFVFVGIAACVIIGMTLKAITTIVTGISRERSRREIAAYIAEGSISPDQGERLMKADVNSDQQA